MHKIYFTSMLFGCLTHNAQCFVRTEPKYQLLRTMFHCNTRKSTSVNVPSHSCTKNLTNCSSLSLLAHIVLLSNSCYHIALCKRDGLVIEYSYVWCCWFWGLQITSDPLWSIIMLRILSETVCVEENLTRAWKAQSTYEVVRQDVFTVRQKVKLSLCLTN
jgi:hypothetical protein